MNKEEYIKYDDCILCGGYGWIYEQTYYFCEDFEQYDVTDEKTQCKTCYGVYNRESEQIKTRLLNHLDEKIIEHEEELNLSAENSIEEKTMKFVIQELEELHQHILNE